MHRAVVRTTTLNNDVVCFDLLHQLFPSFHFFSTTATAAINATTH
jgi:hypothetical protein